jgi:hypothetical protein
MEGLELGPWNESKVLLHSMAWSWAMGVLHMCVYCNAQFARTMIDDHKGCMDSCR